MAEVVEVTHASGTGPYSEVRKIEQGATRVEHKVLPGECRETPCSIPREKNTDCNEITIHVPIP